MRKGWSDQYPQPCHRVTGETIERLEEEWLGAALNEAISVMRGHGLEKHGPQKWATQSYAHQVEKCTGHIQRDELDPESGKHSAAHAVVRALFALAIAMKR